MKKEFDTLYQSIIDSEDDKKMHVLGTVTKSMMYKFIDAYPQQAREYLDMLQAVKWHNYVTMKECPAPVPVSGSRSRSRGNNGVPHDSQGWLGCR